MGRHLKRAGCAMLPARATAHSPTKLSSAAACSKPAAALRPMRSSAVGAGRGWVLADRRGVPPRLPAVWRIPGANPAGTRRCLRRAAAAAAFAAPMPRRVERLDSDAVGSRACRQLQRFELAFDGTDARAVQDPTRRGLARSAARLRRDSARGVSCYAGPGLLGRPRELTARLAGLVIFLVAIEGEVPIGLVALLSAGSVDPDHDPQEDQGIPRKSPYFANRSTSWSMWFSYVHGGRLQRRTCPERAPGRQ